MAEKKLLPPGPKARFPLQHALAMGTSPIKFLMRIRTYGDIVHFKVRNTPFFLINHPDLIRDILVTHHSHFYKGRAIERIKRLLGEGLLTSEGDFHMRQRRLAQPAFHPQRIASYSDVMAAEAARISTAWEDGATLDIAQEMKRLAMVIAGRTLFGAEVESEAEEITRALTAALELFAFSMLPFGEYLEKIPLLPGARRFLKAKARLDALIYRIIAQRRQSGEDHGDLLSMLLLARDTEGSAEGMTDLQLRDEAMTLFLAGHETTANAMTWTWYLLSQNPDAEAKLHAEIDSVLQGRLPVADDVRKLRYTEMVFAESMRIYPPAWAVGRRVIKETPLGAYDLPEGAIAIMSQFVMHRDERYFPDPEKFIPERFTPEERAKRPKFAYFPFGGGPRVCIGEQFAWQEGILLIATIARHWRMRLWPKQRIQPQALVTLRSKYGMKMVLERRKKT